MVGFERSDREIPYAKTLSPEEVSHESRMSLIADQFIDESTNHNYRQGRNTFEQFLFVGEQLRQLAGHPGVEFDESQGVYLTRPMAVGSIEITSVKLENVQLQLEFRFGDKSRGGFSRLDIFWYTRAVDTKGIELSTPTAFRALDPIRLERHELLGAKILPEKLKTKLDRRVNYASQAVDLYQKVFSMEQDAEAEPKRPRTPKKNDKIALKVLELIGE